MAKRMEVVRVTIEGPVGSGKTILAARIQEYLLNLGAAGVVLDDGLRAEKRAGGFSHTPAEQSAKLRHVVVLIEEHVS